MLIKIPGLLQIIGKDNMVKIPCLLTNLLKKINMCVKTFNSTYFETNVIVIVILNFCEFCLNFNLDTFQLS